jgi:asparagine synthase (glutamine-hydrolysing)
MVSPDHRFVITFNGEIYNFKMLRTSLEKAGQSFSTQTDTEVLLRLWSLEGPACLAKVRGMFAFAIWDNERHTLFLARDRFGIKPLYFKVGAKSFAFASELRALRNGHATISPEGLGAFLKWGSVPAPLTIFEGMQALPAASWLEWQQETAALRVSTYWSFEEAWRRSCDLTDGLETDAQRIEWVRETLLDSVRDHLVSDVPVGAFLSGGLDSTSVIALMRCAGQRDIRTVCVAPDELRLDESRAARIAADRFETDHFSWHVDQPQFAHVREHFLDALDQPTVDGLNTFLAARAAHDCGLKVVTSGAGADELFRGYSRTFQHVPALYRTMSLLPARAKAILGTVIERLPNVYGSHRLRKLSALLTMSDELSHVYLWSRALFTTTEVRSLIADEALAERAAAVDMMPFARQSLPDDAPYEAMIALLEMRRYLASQLLLDSDVFSMRHSLELRLPFVDHVVFERLVALPAMSARRTRVASKALLAAAVPEIPEEITRRRKQPFTLPMNSWLHGTDISLSSDILCRNAAAETIKLGLSGQKHWSTAWAILTLDRFVAGL